MIIVKILGGLGNQLFQYAAASALAKKNNTIVKLDISSFERDKLRGFELSAIDAKFSIASDAEIQQYKAKNSFERIKARFTPYPKKKFYKQPYFHYDNDFPSLPKDVYIQGYFQSEKYFSFIARQLKQELRLSFPSSKHLVDILKEIRTSYSVSIHIRKGDYKNPEMMKVHGILAVEYYRKAVRIAQEKINNIRFFIFSDDPNISAEQFELPNAIIVSGQISKNHLEDFYLMSQCRHNIIANSSFSWWAAWLNNNPDKTVIAPEKWFNDGPKDTYDIIPLSWIKL